MKGIELSEAFYNEYGLPMLREQFPELLDKIALGICGSGSECFGYDDEISQDHDFEPGFCIFIPDESQIDSKTEFRLERAYSKLPKEFMGYKRSVLKPVGGARHGVIRISDFLSDKTGTPSAELSLREWLTLPEQALSEVTNGKIFYDGPGTLTRVRESLAYLPEEVRLKKLAGNLLIMAQSGQYNYSRCISRNEGASAQLAIFELVKSALSVIFLLNRRYIPYYKWTFRGNEVSKRMVAIKYALVWVGSLLLNSYGTEFVHYLLSNWQWLSSIGFKDAGCFMTAQLLVSFIVSVFWNILLQRYFVFQDLDIRGFFFPSKQQDKNND